MDPNPVYQHTTLADFNKSNSEQSKKVRKADPAQAVQLGTTYHLISCSFLVVCPFPKLTLVSEWAVSLLKTVLKDIRLVIWRTVCASTVRLNGTRSLLVPLRHISLTIVKIFKRTFVLSGGSSPQNV